MELKGLIKNPWVIGGGLALGVVILMSRGSSAAPVANDGGGMIAAYNSAAMSSNLAMAQIDAGVTNNRLATGTTMALGVLSFLQADAANRHVTDVQLAQVEAGVTNFRIASVQATLQDQETFLSKLTQTYVGAAVANHVSDNDLQGIAIQSAAAVTIARKQAQAQVKTAAIGGAASVAGSLISGLTKMFAPVPTPK